MPSRKAAAKLPSAARRTVPGVTQPAAVTRSGPGRSGKSLPFSQSTASLCRLVAIWISVAQHSAASSASQCGALPAAQARLEPTRTGATETLSVRGRIASQAMRQAFGRVTG